MSCLLRFFQVEHYAPITAILDSCCIPVMTTADDHPDLPSPTNRDSAASAIFNLYGYSNRDSSQVEDKRGVKNGYITNGVGEVLDARSNGSEEDGLVEELQSPRAGEAHQATESETQGRLLSDGISDTNVLKGSVAKPSTITGRHMSMALAPSLPVFSQAHNPASHRHSSAVSGSTPQNGSNRKEGSLQNSGEPFAAIEEEHNAYLTVPSDTPQAPADHKDALIGRQPGEEEDAYHVRLTCECRSAFQSVRAKA